MYTYVVVFKKKAQPDFVKIKADYFEWTSEYVVFMKDGKAAAWFNRSEIAGFYVVDDDQE